MSTGELDALIAGVQTGEVERAAFVAPQLAASLPLFNALLDPLRLRAQRR